MFVKALIIASLAFCGVASFSWSPYETCEGAPEPENLYIENCDYFPCPIYTGYNVNAQWDFLATNEITTLKPVARFKLLRFWVEYKNLNINGCDNLVGKAQKCPLKPNDVGTFELSFPVPNVSMPMDTLSIWIEFSLQDQNEKVHSCFRVNFLVKKGH
ncbi:GSCOCG00005879001-RA-CDS [Cotesia congregata]|uniref:MD-2-related lipid-recognition domain-containing protein n=1 Tax=Cotesia congregata TaxID=51543 RepID=A0A8J2HNQ2_COTCN|nr:GSCOCG00005879001-RA-CDS [Cotesia congregata]CAG5106647.1 Protein of unknown function [Cotesia congregata]